MAKIPENTLTQWTHKASDAEDARYEWTKKEVAAALTGGDFAKWSFDVYPKGSYPNNTNVVRDSDVDIAVELTTFFQNDFVHGAEGLGIANVGVTPYTGGYTLARFKDDVELAVIRAFGDAAVERGKKAFHIRESRLGLAADVVPCVPHREYHSATTYHQGTLLRNDAHPWVNIVNSPRQHLD